MNKEPTTAESLCSRLERLPVIPSTSVMSAISTVSSQVHSLRYLFDLEISKAELERYLSKSGALALCYAGFSHNNSYHEAVGAGKAAFLSCAYDVASDWRDKSDPKWAKKFEEIVCAEASPELAQMALNLYADDVAGKLQNDGLERGIVALRFVLEMMGLQNLYEKMTDVDRLGTLLQIVDDVLDYENDLKTGDENCLKSPRRHDYLKMIGAEMSDEQIHLLFPNGGILLIAIQRARNKAKTMAP